MKDYVLELVSNKKGFNTKINAMREYLQAYILRIMSGEGIFRDTAFLGGTALRFLYNLPRYSEDLDFSVIEPKGYPFINLIKRIKQELILSGYDISLSYNNEKAVCYAFVRFSGLMYEAGLSPLKEQKFSIKIEIDTNPPPGAVLEKHIVNKYFPFVFFSYDIPSLFSGKLHALLNRRYTKGRDFFDLGWYLSKWKDLFPNIPLLQNALRQTGWSGELPTQDNWRQFLYQIIKRTDWNKVKKDVENFLETQKDLDIFTKENVIKLLGL